MRNWRSFHGDHEIVFSIDPKRPVTLLLGPNGAGKTALLNAFTWALYGSFTEGFKLPESLVNFEAINLKSSAETMVEIRLTHNDDEYCVTRRTDAHRQVAHEYELTVTKNGQPAVEDDIHRVLPKPLKDVFFFDSESFSSASILEGKAAGQKVAFDVGASIRSLLSGDIYDKASDDLRDAIASKTLEPPKGVREDSIEKAQKEYGRLQASLNAAEDRQKELPGSLAIAKDQASKAKVEAERYDPQEVKKWQLEYERLDTQKRKTEEAVEKSQSHYVDISCGAHGYFSQYAIREAVDRLNTAESLGLMPPRIHESVLDKTLEQGRCMLCLKELADDSRKRIETLREHVSSAEVAIRGLESRTLLRAYLDGGDSNQARISEFVTSLSGTLKVNAPDGDSDLKIIAAILRACIDVANSQHADANRKFDEFNAANAVTIPASGKSPLEIAMLKQAEVDMLTTELAGMDEKVRQLRKQTEDAFNSYKEKSGKSDIHRLKTDAIEVLRAAKSYFDAARQGLEEFGRADFEKAINATYSDLIAKPLEIRVGKDFSIKVHQKNSHIVMPLSQSETVLLLIAFLGAIARLAPHYEEIATQGQQLRRTGDVTTSQKSGFPVVLDAPTSPFDGEYEADVVNALPNLLPQVIVPVSAKSVGVWEGIAARIGHAYVMELTSSDSTNRVVRWNGMDHNYSIQDSEVYPARTRIVSLSKNCE